MCSRSRRTRPLPWVLVYVGLLLMALGALRMSAAQLPKIRVTAGTRTFETSGGERWVPFGVNYFRPGTGWAPQVWKQFDAEATREDFVRMKALGVNCVRVFLTYGSFMNEPGKLEESGLQRFDRFLALAEEAGVYVHPTGPDHWEGLPAWARGDRLAEERVLSALESFWRQFAARFRSREVVFAYDLLNEPEVRWDTPVMRERWNVWLAQRYASESTLRTAWKRESLAGTWGSLEVPPRPDAPGDARLLDYQRFREDVADEWTRRQVAAIKSADPDALVTVGLIQWSVPAVLGGASQYSGFRPDRQARHLDFMEIHFYPLADGAYRYQGAEAEARNLAYLECVVGEVARCGKPVVVAEFGWYGGGQPKHVGGVTQPATEEQQAGWCRAVVQSTRGLATGWLNWGFYDQPEARDVSELIGLVKPDGTVKAWGRDFAELSRARWELSVPPTLPRRPPLDWEACVTSATARAEFMGDYLAAWRADHPIP